MNTESGRVGKRESELALARFLPCQLPTTLAEWREVGERLLALDAELPWFKGTWWNHGEQFLGGSHLAPHPSHLNAAPLTLEAERALYQAIAKLIPMDDAARATFSTYGWVCRHVPVSIRIETLSFTHHREVAALERKEQVRLLALCEKNGWSVMDLREAIRGKRPALEAPLVRFALPRWKNEFMREVAREDPRSWPADRRARTKEELRPIVEFWEKL